MSDPDLSAAARPLARAPRGFGDRRARDLRAEAAIVTAVSGVYERFGFERLDTPAFEYADALGKFLPDADRPNEGVFALQDDDEQWMALRYDLTAPLARFAAQTWETLPKPFRRYAVGPVWRDEKPGPGRYREFLQCDADTVGSARPEADAEVIAMAVEGLRAVGLPAGAALMKIGSREILDGVMLSAGIAGPVQLQVLRAMDKLDRLGLDGVEALLGRGRLDESGAFTAGAGLDAGAVRPILDFLGGPDATRAAYLDWLPTLGLGEPGNAAIDRVARIDAALTAMGVGDEDARFDQTIVRGLAYYTSCVFEADLLLETRDEQGRPVRFGSIGGGGRYDDLIARFTGQSVPATGFSFGVSRLAAALAAVGREPAPARGPVVVLTLDAEAIADDFALAAELRAAGLAAEVYLGQAGMKAQMKYADRRLSPAAVIVGSDERAAGAVTVKDLDAGRAASAALKDNAAWKGERPGQVTVARADLVAVVRGIVGA